MCHGDEERGDLLVDLPEDIPQAWLRGIRIIALTCSRQRKTKICAGCPGDLGKQKDPADSQSDNLDPDFSSPITQVFLAFNKKAELPFTSVTRPS